MSILRHAPLVQHAEGLACRSLVLLLKGQLPRPGPLPARATRPEWQAACGTLGARATCREARLQQAAARSMPLAVCGFPVDAASQSNSLAAWRQGRGLRTRAGDADGALGLLAALHAAVLLKLPQGGRGADAVALPVRHYTSPKRMGEHKYRGRSPAPLGLSSQPHAPPSASSTRPCRCTRHTCTALPSSSG